MLIWKCFIFIVACHHVRAVRYPNVGSEMSEEETVITEVTKDDSSQQQEPEKEIETDRSDIDKIDDKSVLQEALNIVLNTDSIVHPAKEDEVRELLNVIEADNQTLDQFLLNMDKLSEDYCKKTQEALWFYVTDANSDEKRKAMFLASRQEDEVKSGYWNILKNNYIKELSLDPSLQRKIRVIKEKAVNIINPESQEREDIASMQRIWSNALVCAYNTSCGPRNIKGFSDIISIFKTSKNSDELLYYWKQFRDVIGAKIRPIFTDHVIGVNTLARSNNFSDAGEVWRFSFEDENFIQTVRRLWYEIKPLYNDLRIYVREKLKNVYKNHITDDSLPSHLLGNLWGQEWQSLYSLVAPHPEHKLLAGVRISSRSLFDDVDDFYVSMGFVSLEDAYRDVDDYQKPVADCIPSSHDFCDGVTFRIRWCGKSEPAIRALSRAATLLGQVQYYLYYSHLPVHFRSGPTPAFKISVPNVVSSQLTSPDNLKRLKLLVAPLSDEIYLNHLLWVALEKLPLVGYAYVLDSWRWDVFAGQEQLNKHWWDLRLNETGISAPVSRDESSLDPAAKYHVVSHMQYITYLISEVLEYQMLLALCKAANHTGPLHRCSLYGSKEAGSLLSKGMRLGARKDWRAVLKTITGESELSTKGILEYFQPLQHYLLEKNEKMLNSNEYNHISLSLAIGIVLALLTAAVLFLYCFISNSLGTKIISALGITQNGSLDIATTEMSVTKTNEPSNGVNEAKM